MFSFTVQAEIKPEQSFIDKIKSQYHIEHVKTVAKGTLDNSSSEYYAVLYKNRIGEEETDVDVAIAVFKNENGNINKIDESKIWECSEYREECNIRISNKSLILSHTGSGGACSHGITNYQFKYREDKLMLIGVEDTESSCYDALFYSIGNSVNLLSGKYITWYESGESQDETNVMYSFKDNHHEKKFDIQNKRSWLLSEFSEDDYQEWKEKATPKKYSFEVKSNEIGIQ